MGPHWVYRTLKLAQLPHFVRNDFSPMGNSLFSTFERYLLWAPLIIIPNMIVGPHLLSPSLLLLLCPILLGSHRGITELLHRFWVSLPGNLSHASLRYRHLCPSHVLCLFLICRHFEERRIFNLPSHSPLHTVGTHWTFIEYVIEWEVMQ